MQTDNLSTLTGDQLFQLERAIHDEWRRRKSHYATNPAAFAEDVRGFSDDLLSHLYRYNEAWKESYGLTDEQENQLFDGLQCEYGRRYPPVAVEDAAE